MSRVPSSGQFEHRTIEYMKLKDFRGLDESRVDDFPFIKRLPYKDEKEYRIIFTDKNRALDFHYLKIDLNCIDRITLSPYLNNNLTTSLKQFLWSIDGCEELEIYRSGSIRNQQWINKIDSLS